ncbi:MAG: DUF4491 family protein [Prevotellaceae bacterium]|jgi:hypothetical protein|nr:DUF4491 family protein [Prevotellaceae bacterium]
MNFIETYNLTGIIVGLATFLIIGIFHPLVIKGEYYFGLRCRWAFLAAGIAGLAISVAVADFIVSSLCGVFAFSSLWGIHELYEQRKRVEKGWFPKRDKKTADK